ncbi:MAG: purine nucleoside phosphorylase [actinobacterium acAMD-5]|nr:MAG: purine nucleoside phosphorylase [actinobacterium acAMD-5]
MSIDTEGLDPYQLAASAARVLAKETKVVHHDVLVVLGSGWTPAADAFGPASTEISVTELPGFSAPAVAGHSGKLRSVRVGNLNVLIQMGRTHYYEGKGAHAVVHAVRTAIAAGVKTVVLTNAAGSLNPKWVPGTPVLIKDQINLTGGTPLVGARFVDVTEIYSKRLRNIAKQVSPNLEEGIYTAFHGPQYETPAEIAMVRAMGGDLVGMSTALESIAAREGGAEVLGISLVTNLAAGMSGETLNHEEVLAAGKSAAETMGKLLVEVVRNL